MYKEIKILKLTDWQKYMRPRRSCKHVPLLCEHLEVHNPFPVEGRKPHLHSSIENGTALSGPQSWNIQPVSVCSQGN